MNDTTNWEEELSKAAVWIEDLSTNGDTLLIKVKDMGKAFEYGIYDQKKIEALIPSFLSSQKQAVEKLIESKRLDEHTYTLGGGTYEEKIGYNNALDDILNELTKI